MADTGPILLLGAAGFLGRHVHSALDAAGLVAVAPAHRRRAAGGDVVDGLDLLGDDLSSALEAIRPRAIVNCVGRAHGAPGELVEANVMTVARLVEAIADRPVRLVHIGSAAEYGGSRAALRESDPAAPASVYGVTKLAATGLVLAMASDAVVLRVFNPVGAGMAATSLPGRAASLLRSALRANGGEIELGDLSAERDFVDVRDVADAVVAAVRASEPPSLVNVGSGTPTVVRDLVRVLADVAGFMGDVREGPPRSPGSSGPDRAFADISLARQRLGWAPRRSLANALGALWAASGTG